MMKKYGMWVAGAVGIALGVVATLAYQRFVPAES